MILLDGKSLSETILSDLKLKIENYGQKINLDIILVGDNPSSLKYISLKQAKSKEVGINGHLYHLENFNSFTLKNIINYLNNRSQSTAFFIQLPIADCPNPDHFLSLISPAKDIDGLNTDSGIIPAVVQGITALLKHYKIDFTDKNIVIINDSKLVGQPLKKYFLNFTSQVFLLNDQIKNISQYTKTADILISATGVKNLITGNMIKEGSVIVDVANGDIDFNTCSQKAAYITPTYGGIGPMTVASLLQNCFFLSSKS